VAALSVGHSDEQAFSQQPGHVILVSQQQASSPIVTRSARSFLTGCYLSFRLFCALQYRFNLTLNITEG